MTKNGVDLIEIGRGNESKVIGQNNSISEYGTVALSFIAFVGQGALVGWVVIGLWLYYVGFLIVWAVIISGILTAFFTGLAVFGIVKLVFYLHKINNPPQPRLENGRFASPGVPYSEGGKRVGTFHAAGNGENAYIEKWGGGGD